MGAKTQILLLTGSIVLFGPLSVLAFLNYQSIPYGVSINNQNVGTQDRETVIAELKEKIVFFENAEIVLKKDNKILEKVLPKDIGLALDIDATVAQAYSAGRKGNVLSSIFSQIHVALTGKNLEIITTIDDHVLETFLSKNLEKLEHKAQDASLIYSKKEKKLEIKSEKQGTVIDRSRLKYDLAENAAKLTQDDIIVTMRNDIPLISQLMVEKPVEEANKILELAPITLLYINPSDTSEKQNYEISKEQLKDMFILKRDKRNAFNLDISTEELRSFLVQLAPSINKKPRNAVLTFENEKVTEFALSQNGIELDVEQSLPYVKENILQKEKDIKLFVQTTPSDIRTETIENLGLTALLGVGESDFKGSSSSRAFNIKLGAEKLNGTLIGPNEEFSFLETLGEVGPKEGFQYGLVIKGKELIKEYGGGLCQVSTTTFRAAMHSGLKITERAPHSLPVRYYDPQGFDAAIYGPYLDLKFINDTPSNVLIQAKVEGTKLFFEFYGTPDNRVVKIEGPNEYERNPDGSLKTILTREIYKEEELIATNTFRSSYRSPIKSGTVNLPNFLK